MTEVLAAALLILGLGFQAVASLGVLRLPDFYTRLHAVSKADTVGIMLALAALGTWEGPGLTTVKLAFIAAFFFLTNPTATHAIARAARRDGLRPWTRGEPPR